MNLIAFALSIRLVADPIMIFECRLVTIEKKLDYTYRGSETFSKMIDGLPLREKFKAESFTSFGLGLVLFTLASTLFFTPLPLFFAQELSFSTSMVFMVYMLSSSGAVVGYFLAGRST